MKFRLERVRFVPKELKPGVLYVSEEFRTAAHLCACGCGAKIRTPLGPTEWSVQDTPRGPSLYPSVGNWQQRCKSHYLIRQGEILWAEEWSDQQIAAGRRSEELRRREYFADRRRPKWQRLARVMNWLRKLFRSG